jgi:hypothetical protein
MPAPNGRATLPRRARLEIEIERPIDRIRRTRLSEPIGVEENVLPVDDDKRLTTDPGTFVLVDAEWMQVVRVDSGSLSVKRGARGTTPAGHANGAMVHHGLRFVREIQIPTYREDWNL